MVDRCLSCVLDPASFAPHRRHPSGKLSSGYEHPTEAIMIIMHQSTNWLSFIPQDDISVLIALFNVCGKKLIQTMQQHKYGGGHQALQAPVHPPEYYTPELVGSHICANETKKRQKTPFPGKRESFDI